jgi:hypothetical protein
LLLKLLLVKLRVLTQLLLSHLHHLLVLHLEKVLLVHLLLHLLLVVHLRGQVRILLVGRAVQVRVM